MIGAWSLTVAERRLVDAMTRERPCDFADRNDIRREDMAQWGDERTIRASVLRALLTGEEIEGEPETVGELWRSMRGVLSRARHGVEAPSDVEGTLALDVRGAVISGELVDFNGTRLPSIRMSHCRFDARVTFDGATFVGDASFDGAIFAAPAWFNNTTFTKGASFDCATFTDQAGFMQAKLAGTADFSDASFTGDVAWFHNASFAASTSFRGATFSSSAGFTAATFAGETDFRSTKFNVAWFSEATFTGPSSFKSASFADDAVFTDARFVQPAEFTEATFTETCNFQGSLARALDFSSATFAAPDPGPWVASSVSLRRAILTRRSRISITASTIDASWLQAREGVHLALQHATVDLSDSEFLRRSLVSSSARPLEMPRTAWDEAFASLNETWAGEDQNPETRAAEPKLADDVEVPVASTPAIPADSWTDDDPDDKAAAQVERFRDELAEELATAPPRCRVTSLKQANVGELALSGVVLDDCEFVGAHGLDRVRIGTGCSFRPMPRRLGWRLFGDRRVIVEEIRWRQAHTRGVTGEAMDLAWLPASEIAEIYRDLRKGLEEAKNEPGAADFYYGEMEMRRLAGRKPTSESVQSPRRGGGRPSRTERILLNCYWALSGYGLRVSRALIAFAVVIAAAACLYTLPFFASRAAPPAQLAAVNTSTGSFSYKPTCRSATPSYASTSNSISPELTCPPADFWTALEYSARESISLFQVRGTPTLETTRAGTLLDFALRLAGPLLLGLTILALRARIKR